MTPSPDAIRVALGAHSRNDLPSLPGRTNHIRAGVLIPLVWRDELEVVLTVRSAGLRLYAREVCFPGGRPDPGDSGLEETALREAHEELGIANATILGRLSSMPLYTSDHRLEPFVAAVPDQQFTPAPAEVDQVLMVSIRSVLALPFIAGIPAVMLGKSSLSPVLDFGPHRMYGATAHTFVEMLDVLAPLMGIERPPLQDSGIRWSELLPPGFSVADI